MNLPGRKLPPPVSPKKQPVLLRPSPLHKRWCAPIGGEVVGQRANISGFVLCPTTYERFVKVQALWPPDAGIGALFLSSDVRTTGHG